MRCAGQDALKVAEAEHCGGDCDGDGASEGVVSDADDNAPPTHPIGCHVVLMDILHRGVQGSEKE